MGTMREESGETMTTRIQRAKRRRWADVVLIVATLYAVMSAFWAPLELIMGGDGREVADSQALWLTYALGGALGLAALAASMKHAGLAKVLAAAAGVAVLAGFFTLAEVTPFAAISIGLTGLGLIAASPFIGPMPSPEDEGKSRAPGEN